MIEKVDMYIAFIGSGTYEGYYESMIFASNDKNKVDNWVDRFNRIIRDNYDRVSECSDNECFWYDLIIYERSMAFMRTVSVR